MESNVLDKKQRNAILNILMYQKKTNDQVLFDIATGETIEWDDGEEPKKTKLQQDIEANKNVCEMTTCLWNVAGKCENNGVDLLDDCKKNNFKHYEGEKK